MTLTGIGLYRTVIAAHRAAASCVIYFSDGDEVVNAGRVPDRQLLGYWHWGKTSRVYTGPGDE